MNLLEKSMAIKNHEITALDNLEKFSQIIMSKNPDINAFLEINQEKALVRAKEIDNRIKNGEKVGKLAGMVIGIKSNINVEDFTISAASRTLENYLCN
jgi:aspartyl-tRNA(Asn)/glutamyl-tRNA(Gln) amidotransferase subunit A